MYKNINGEYESFFIKPITQLEKNNLPYIIYVTHYNLVFELTYKRILHGNFFFLNNINKNNTLNLLFKIILIFFQITKIILKLLILLIKHKNTRELVSYFYKTNYPYFDDRIIININNK